MAQPQSANAPYQVLARKHRPQSFAALIGQDAMVRTLTNAIREDRIAHAFVLTGVRGVGKTTTARIIAKALNCIGGDGKGGPTAEPCGACADCAAIAESRHVDVLEMDAASRTGVDNIRELLDGVRYLPVQARYKVYIIDEVHMLSDKAFNALLKTLEEPPAHVKFVFATTEIRKIPVTILSRCQRFDLRRVPADLLIQHFRGVLELERMAADEQALELLARAADGSVRDGLSLLDQAIAHGQGKVTAEIVRDMLGLADRARVFALFDRVMAGDAAAALANLREQYDLGADPLAVLQELLELTHWLTRLKVAPEAERDAGVGEVERVQGRAMADRLSMATLARSWQMLLKGLQEARMAPSPLAAAEMALVRLCYSADLPSPAEAIQQLKQGGGASPARAAPAAAPPRPAPSSSPPVRAQAAPALQPEPPPAEEPVALASFDEVVALAEARREGLLASQLRQFVRLVRFEPGRIEFEPAPGAPPKIANALGQRLEEWTGRRWLVSVAKGGAPTAAERDDAAARALLDEVRRHPLVEAALKTFPQARIAAVRDLPGKGKDEP